MLLPRIQAIKANEIAAQMNVRARNRLEVVPAAPSSAEGKTLAAALDVVPYIQDAVWRKAASAILAECRHADASRDDGRVVEAPTHADSVQRLFARHCAPTVTRGMSWTAEAEAAGFTALVKHNPVRHLQRDFTCMAATCFITGRLQWFAVLRPAALLIRTKKLDGLL